MALQKYQAAVLAGNVYTGTVKSATVTVTTDTSPLPATSGRALLGVYNPPGSGKRLSVLRIGTATVSGTPGGPFYLNVMPPSVLLTGVPTLPVNNRDFTIGGGVGKVFAAFVPINAAILTELRPIGGVNAAAVAGSIGSTQEDVDGMISIPPGGMLTIQSHAVGSTHIMSAYITWEEVSI